ncbi:MAG: sugar ABC transporter ATP-binding protein [Brachybacterium sp.]|uniref:sugar ABC transporter ATP-binding protein n=1 Tax=Brachybacterium sp. TaxID=1891286 RepID=UPI003F908684
MSTPILVAENLSIAFGEVRALDDVTLSINEGEIRCLAGENGSGKSTFVKIVSGVYRASNGSVTVNGHEISEHDPRAAIAAGVQVIYQDLALFDHLSVAENIAINWMLHHGSKFVKSSHMRQIAAEQLARIGVDLPLEDPASSLSVANRQLVAIARALSMDARILFMDEPTTALTSTEVRRLLTIVRELKAEGLAIVFISHKLDEVFEVADSITIFRDGKKVGDFAASELNSASLSFHMTGREVLHTPYHRAATPEDDDESPLLELRGLTRQDNYKDIDLHVRPGDILGITGLLGAGRTELALSLFGLNRPDSGEILVRGKKVAIREPWDAIGHGIALVPEDRSVEGLFLAQPTVRNVSSSRLDQLLGKLPFVNVKAERALAQKTVHEMGVNNKNIDSIVGNLSGGNQQKVVIGKWLATNPQVLILDSPTVGIDIGSKSEIYGQIQQLAAQGIGVILISDEPEEIVANCNRVVVMYDGDIIASFDEEDRAEPDFEQRLAGVVAEPESAEIPGGKHP